jgi:hypothetical protein
MTLFEFILKAADLHLGKSITGGYNGPHHDPEFATRNLSHWIITYKRCFDWTGNNNYKQKLKELVSELMNPELRPNGTTFIHREKAGKDKCNGLIGASWVIEALCIASSGSSINNQLLSVAINLQRSFSFDPSQGLWKIVDVDGSDKGFDHTYNHQLWFAYATLLLAKSLEESNNTALASSLIETANIFFLKTQDNLTLVDGGLIFHPIERELLPNIPSDLTLKQKFSRFLFRYNFHPNLINKSRNSGMRRLFYVSRGYQSFNALALTQIYKLKSTGSIFPEDNLKSILQYTKQEKYLLSLHKNEFTYTYNNPAFELPAFVNKFYEQKDALFVTKHVWKKFTEEYFDVEKFEYFDAKVDELTCLARIYELTHADINFLKKFTING